MNLIDVGEFNGRTLDLG